MHRAPPRAPAPRFDAPRPAYGGSPRPNPNARKRMMAQGRKGHFMFDAKAVLVGTGEMEDQHVRAFLEGIFQRGTRKGTEDALDYLGEKVDDGTVNRDQANRLANLIDRYSFWR